MRRRLVILAALALTMASSAALSTPGALAAMRQKPLPFAGYLVTQSGAAGEKVSADFTVPTLKCPSTGTYGVAPGVSVGNDDFEQSGGVVAACSSGAASYEATIVLGNTNYPVFAVSAGDTMSATVSTTGTAAYSVTIADLTHPASSTMSCPGKCGSETQAWFGDEPTYTAKTMERDPVARFTTNKFTHVLVDGADLGSASPTAYDLLEPDTTVVLIEPSAISGKTAFTDTFEHSS